MDALLIKDGLVAAVMHGAVSSAEQSARLAAIRAEAEALAGRGVTPIEPTGEDLRDMTRSRPIDPDRFDGLHLHGLLTSVASLEAALRDAPELFPAEIYLESVVGQPLVWPRAHRAALLAATDFADLPGWRAGKDAARLTSADAYRQALRGLPEASPDPASVVFPRRPADL